jgi:hypothetical protein
MILAAKEQALEAAKSFSQKFIFFPSFSAVIHSAFGRQAVSAHYLYSYGLTGLPIWVCGLIFLVLVMVFKP